MEVEYSKSALHYVNDEEDYTNEESQIQWSNLIFLPFQNFIKLIVLCSVICKSMLGPIQSIFPIVYCWDTMDRDSYLLCIKYFYWYCSDTIYGIDTFLHIVHRQVTDKAMRREYLPKPAFLLLLDIISIVPFYRMMIIDICPPVQLWPNILAFSEFIIIYRVVEYFSLVTTHSFWYLVIGFTIMLGICINCATCFWLLLTKHGLCANCKTNVYDWRNYVMHKLNETDEGYTTYVYGASLVMSLTINDVYDETKPSTVIEFVVITAMMLLGYIFVTFVVLPKLFAEGILRFRRIFVIYPHVKRIVAETKRRNPSPTAHVSVENFYNLMWKKRSGITNIPEVISELPKYLRVDLRQDLVWPVFYHSPSLRNTSTPFQRWLCEHIRLDYKLPGEKFFTGPHAHTNMYYLKSGIAQLMSTDDGITPLLSFTSGTILGDISYIIPPLKRKMTVRCLTYCEVYIVPRHNILIAMHNYPFDRINILRSVNERLSHARSLYACKQRIRGLDRAEDEGVAWLKKRWWEISHCVASWKKKSSKKDTRSVCELPPEETLYHCAKYIGQLVLCTDEQLQSKSLFANIEFPWILLPTSSFVIIWRRIVVCNVVLVLLLYPPNLSNKNEAPWFQFFHIFIEFLYAADICVSLLTSVTKQENVKDNFTTVMFARFKSLNFLLDVLATISLEDILVIIGKPEMYYMSQYNKLIKIYMLFTDEFAALTYKKDPIIHVSYYILLINFTFLYISGYGVYMIIGHMPNITTTYFFGDKHCVPTVSSTCEVDRLDIIAIAITWMFTLVFAEYLPQTLNDVYFGSCLSYIGFLIRTYCRSLFIAALYLKYTEVTNYQFFVSNLKKYYNYYKIHHNLLKRLDRYLVCHWKHYQGADVIHPNMLKDEPYDVYWKVHGEVAEKIISESIAFVNADPALIRELAHTAKFLILPKNATLFLFGVECKNVTWIVQGHIKCEYHNEDGELLKFIHNPGHMLSVGSVFFGKASLRTYSSCTDCEILYLKIQDFFAIINRYPSERAFFETCIEEFAPIFDEMFLAYAKKHIDYQNKIQDRVFHARMSMSTIKMSKLEHTAEPNPTLFDSDSWKNPESGFMHYWMMFRAIIVFVSIACASLQGGSGAVLMWPLIMVGGFCDCIAWIDIIVKMFLAYHDHRGLLITDKRKCLIHYLTRGFLMDLIGALPWYEVIRALMDKKINSNQAMLMNTFCKFAHLYILMGFFDYIADVPTINVAFIMIVKWQLVTILAVLGVSHVFISQCVNIKFDKNMNLISVKALNICWTPDFTKMDPYLTKKQLHVLFVQSLNFAQCGLMKFNLGKFKVDRTNVGVAFALLFLGIIYWFVVCYSVTLLVLSSRGNTLFQHGVHQLRKFLQAERVDKPLIDSAVVHFRYWWIRTKGINLNKLTSERIGVVFRQDLSYYFFKKTFSILDTLLQGGEPLQRQLASASHKNYFLPGEEIIREMDLSTSVYVIHRGKVILSRDGEKLVTLTKGGIFGQLEGTLPRPVRVSAIAEDSVDLLQINIKQFQDVLSDSVRENIKHNPQSEFDYLATRKHIHENPYNTVQYILRGRKTIQLPWMPIPMEAHRGTWYYTWLYLTCLIEPFVSATMVLIIITLPTQIIYKFYWCLIITDLVFLANLIMEFYTMELTVIDKNCVKRRLGHHLLKRWKFYIDVFTLIVPFLSLVNSDMLYQLVRLLRLRLFFDFNYHLCRSFKSKTPEILLKIFILCLLLHAFTCGWIYIACRGYDESNLVVDIPDIPPEVNITIDYSNWVHPKQKKDGCFRLTKYRRNNTGSTLCFVVPKNWQDDYIVALIYIVIIHTHTSMDCVIPLTTGQMYYKVIVTFFISLIEIWLISLAFNAIYMKLRELYQYDYDVSNLVRYLNDSGLSPSLLESVEIYTKQLWRRQKGNWLPELAHQAPLCLREDLFSALYVHHLRTPPFFRQIPDYFIRQLATRLQRIVLFPGKYIVQEGDIFPCMFFIHEGEVEKWYVDSSGESKLMSLLIMNGYFGVVAGMFPNTAFKFTYYTRTVVDLVFLRLKDWQDLLDGYPDIKRDLYTGAKQYRRQCWSHIKLIRT